MSREADREEGVSDEVTPARHEAGRDEAVTAGEAAVAGETGRDEVAPSEAAAAAPAADTARTDMLEQPGTGGQVVMDMPQETAVPAEPPSPLGDLDYHLFAEGTHLRLWEKMGAHLRSRAGRACTSGCGPRTRERSA